MSTRPISTKILESAASHQEAEIPDLQQVPLEPEGVSAPRFIDEIALMIVMVLIAAILVALVVLYISEYACITHHGYTQMKLRQELQRKRLAIAAARAEVENLKRQERILTTAVQEYRMAPLRQVQQMPAPPSLLRGKSDLAIGEASLPPSEKMIPGLQIGTFSLIRRKWEILRRGGAALTPHH